MELLPGTFVEGFREAAVAVPLDSGCSSYPSHRSFARGSIRILLTGMDDVYTRFYYSCAGVSGISRFSCFFVQKIPPLQAFLQQISYMGSQKNAVYHFIQAEKEKAIK